MSWLARLKNQQHPETDPTETTKRVSVVSVAPISALTEKTGVDPIAANDPAPDPDRWAWPHSTAINGAEIDTFTARLALFTEKGLSLAEAEALADTLVIRDRDADDRRLCLECANVRHGGGMWGCGQWRVAKLGAGGLPADLVRVLQRCDAFKECCAMSTTQSLPTFAT